MDTATHERQRQALHGVVSARRVAGVLLAAGVATALLAGVAGGLARLGLVLPASADAAWLPRAALAHAALMMCAFMGTMVGVERAVAARRRLAWTAPFASAASGACLLAGADAVAGLLLAVAGIAFTAVNVLLLRRQRAAHTALLLASALAWLAGNLLFAAGAPAGAVLPWWFAFLVITIAAERLEMTRLMRRRPGAQASLQGVLALMLLGAAASGPWPLAGGLLFGGALTALAVWLVVFDIARRTVRAAGLPRYMAVCLLGGYGWLAAGGLCWMATAAGWPARDAALHAVALGFIFSMMMGHAPVILPAIARIKLQFGPVFYVPLALLHASLLLRLAGGATDFRWRADGALFNAVALALFAATAVGAAIAWRRRHGGPRSPHENPMTNFLNIEEPASRRAPPPQFALWQLGFRPFYLLASLFAAVSIALWALQFSGWLPLAYLQGPLWHAHEMLFGFTLAVVVGFLLTAGRNWTNRPTPTGGRLAALAALWVAGRILVLTPYGWAAALVTAAFPLAAAIALGIPFYKARSKRNYFFVGLLVLLSLATLCVHLAQLGVVTLPPWVGIQLALDAVLFILCVMGGRVIPMFTNNGVPGTRARRVDWLEKAALGAVLALLATDAVQPPAPVLALVAAVAAALHLARWWLWQPWRTLRTPLVWVLHLAYLWIPVHLLLRALAAFELVLPSAATHALTVGAVGGLVIGMMTRTARGHTARELRADAFDSACYVLVSLAALVRVVLPLALPEATVSAVLASAGLWSAGFALYAVRYWNVLTRPRLDGRPG